MDGDLNLSMFRAYDIRTPSSQLPSPQAWRLAAAEAVYFRDVLQATSVVLAHDARRTGPYYLSVASEAFRNAGLEVIYLPGPCSTSLFYYAAMCHPRAAAVMIGASHNPADDTGQKILGPGVTPIAAETGPEGGLDRIKELYITGKSAEASRRGRIRPCEIIGPYIEYSMRLAGVAKGGLKGTRILLDFLHGAAGREMLLAFDLAAADLHPLHFTPDGSFPLGDPNPVKQSVIREGLEILRSGEFQMAAFFDGDGDRIDFYRGSGEYLSSSFVYAAVLPEIRQRFPEPGRGVFADLKSNPRAVIEMARTGVRVDVIRNGHSQIKQSLLNDPSRFGCVEESAHFYEAFPGVDNQRFCTENTLYIALLVARVWSEQAGRFDTLFELQRTTAREREWGYKFATAAQRAEALAAVREHFEAQGAQSLTRMRNGMDLEATLMRRGLPMEVDENTRFSDDWLQVCQRISQSENGLARWEVVGARPGVVQQAKQEIARCAAQFGAGDEYQG